MIGIALSWIGLDTPGGLIPIKNWKLNIHQDQVWSFAESRCDSLLAILRFDHFESGTRQQIAHNPTIILLVLDHKNALAHARPFTTRAFFTTFISTPRRRIDRFLRPASPENCATPSRAPRLAG